MSYFGIPVRNGLPIGLGTVAPLGINTFSPFSPASFFANGEQGWWYDPSNFATLFQDSAGTTPVTAVEQPVGLQLDLSGRNNHRFQTTSANRPVVSARVNLLTKTEQFDDAAWSKTATTITANSTIAPDGTTTADTLTMSSIAGILKFATSPTTVAGTFTQELSFRRGNADWVVFFTSDGLSSYSAVWLNTSTGDPGSVVNVGTFSGATATVVPQNNGYFRLRLTFTKPATAASDTFGVAVVNGNGSFVSTIGQTTIIWGADLRYTNQGIGLPVYQRVNTSTDYDSTGFPVYIKPNGSNQFMQTNSINFTATDKMTVWQGVRKLSDLTTQSSGQNIIELSSIIDTNAGSFNLSGSIGFSTNIKFAFQSRGSASGAGAATTLSALAAPVSAVLTGVGDISGDLGTLRVNGAQVAQSTADQGTGNYGNYPAYFYMRGGTSLPFNGNDYGSIARGAASTAAQITNGETYINSLTKAY
jgi:hypothetical protein